MLDTDISFDILVERNTKKNIPGNYVLRRNFILYLYYNEYTGESDDRITYQIDDTQVDKINRYTMGKLDSDLGADFQRSEGIIPFYDDLNIFSVDEDAFEVDIPGTTFNTYLWDGYIKTTSDTTIHFGISSFHDCYVWIREGTYTWKNHLGGTGNGTKFPEEFEVLTDVSNLPISDLASRGFTLVCSDSSMGSVGIERYGEEGVDYDSSDYSIIAGVDTQGDGSKQYGSFTFTSDTIYTILIKWSRYENSSYEESSYGLSPINLSYDLSQSLVGKEAGTTEFYGNGPFYSDIEHETYNSTDLSINIMITVEHEPAPEPEPEPDPEPDPQPQPEPNH